MSAGTHADSAAKRNTLIGAAFVVVVILVIVVGIGVQ
jgi:hypothetical protein